MSWSNDTKPSSTFTNDTKQSSTWSVGMGYLLTQALGFLLLENGGKIILDQSYNNKPSNVWANDAK